MPKHNHYGKWPRSGEIKLLKCRGNYNYTLDSIDSGVRRSSFGIVMGTGKLWQTAESSAFNESGFNANFHKYQFEWSPSHLKFSIDDKEIVKLNNEERFPFDQEFYIVIYLSVGGRNNFPDRAVNEPYEKPWKNRDSIAVTNFWKAKDQWLPTWNLAEDLSRSASLAVNYIRVWAL
jgi:beta-glucanase (GH16 family)